MTLWRFSLLQAATATKEWTEQETLLLLEVRENIDFIYKEWKSAIRKSSVSRILTLFRNLKLTTKLSEV